MILADLSYAIKKLWYKLSFHKYFKDPNFMYIATKHVFTNIIQRLQ